MNNFKYKTFEGFLNKSEEKKDKEIGDQSYKQIRKGEEAIENNAIKFDKNMANKYSKLLGSAGKEVKKREDILNNDAFIIKLKKGIDTMFKNTNLPFDINYLNKIYNINKGEDNKKGKNGRRGREIVHTYYADLLKNEKNDEKIKKQKEKEVAKMSTTDTIKKVEPKKPKADLPENLKKLGDKIVNESYSPLLEKGIKSDYVTLMLHLLKRKGYDVNVESKIFDEIVDKIVKQYQSRNQLDSDGVVGKQTWSKLLGKTIGRGYRLEGYKKTKTKETETETETETKEEDNTNISDVIISKDKLISMLESLIMEESTYEEGDRNISDTKNSFFKIDKTNKHIIKLDNNKEDTDDYVSFINIENDKIKLNDGEKEKLYKHLGKEFIPNENSEDGDVIETEDNNENDIKTINIEWESEDSHTIDIRDNFIPYNTTPEKNATISYLTNFLDGVVDAIDYVSSPSKRNISEMAQLLDNLNLVKDVKVKKEVIDGFVNRKTDNNIINGYKKGMNSYTDDIPFLDIIKMGYEVDEGDSMEDELKEFGKKTKTDAFMDMKKIIEDILIIIGIKK